MGYSIFEYDSPILTEIEDLEQAKEEALHFVNSTSCDFIEVRGPDDQTVTIGYFDGSRFHWTRDKVQTEAWKGCGFVTKPPIWQQRFSK